MIVMSAFDIFLSVEQYKISRISDLCQNIERHISLGAPFLSGPWAAALIAFALIWHWIWRDV